MATLATPRPSRLSRKIVALLQKEGVVDFCPEKAVIIRQGRDRSDSLRDTPARWYLHQESVYHIHVTGWDTATDVLKYGPAFSFWDDGVHYNTYNCHIREIDVYANRSAL